MSTWARIGARCRGTYALMGTALLVLAAGCGEDFFVPATGTVYGKVVYPDGEPASNSRVIVEGTGIVVFTDDEGDFVTNDLVAVDYAGISKRYTLRGEAVRDGVDYGFLVRHLLLKSQQAYTVDPDEYPFYSVAPGVIELKRTGRIIGFIAAESIRDNTGTQVTIEGTSLTQTTGLFGSFDFPAVPPETHGLLIERPGFQPKLFDPVIVEPGELEDLSDIFLPVMAPEDGGIAEFGLIIYNRDIQPIFTLNCSVAGCHNAETRAAGLQLTNHRGVFLEGSDNGAVVVPFDPEASVLMHKIRAGHPADVSGHSPLPNAYIRRIEAWINQDAGLGETLAW